jgi:uncharacterized protein
MKTSMGQMRLSASDLSNHLACRHVTTLDLEVARGLRAAPDWAAPDLKVIQELGLRHEVAYLAHLRGQGLNVENLESIDHKNEKRLLEETLALMERGVDVIAQGALRDGEWFGRPDVLRRVARGGGKWDWSYEVADTKLARETKATTILQLSLYSELLGKAQGVAPEFLWVVPPGMGFAGEKYRVGEYAAYYRYVKERLVRAVGNRVSSEKEAASEEGAPGQYALGFGGAQAEACATYPEPVEHCNVCRWFRECDGRRRADDHLSLVAGIRRQQRDQFEEWDAGTMAKLAELPIPLKERPKHGARVGYERAREQARVQVEGRTENKLKHEPLAVAEGMGLCRLPEPAAGDVFLDLEGDPFVGEQGLQYLFGFAYRDAAGEWRYEKKWALHREEEKAGFEWVVDEIMRRRAADPKMHVYHFGGYEPGALKRLMGMYATREDEIDRMLRAGVLVDLHQAFKQSTRASVEEYSLKKIEAFYGFVRATPLDLSRAAMRYVEHRLELGRLEGAEEIPEEFREALEGYNGEDCVSTGKLRDWLEERRAELVARGMEVPRLPEKSGDPSEKLEEKLERAAALTELLSAGIPVDPTERTEEQAAQWLLAQLLSWHRREDKRAWQDGYRYAEMNDEDLLDERVGLTKMNFVQRVVTGSGRQVSTDRYSFDPQPSSNVRVEKEVYFGDEKFGEVVAIDHARGVVDIKKTKKTEEVHPPTVYMWKSPLPTDAQADSLYRMGAWVVENGVDSAGRYRAGRDLLLRRPPRLLDGEKLGQLASETAVNTATRVLIALADSVFAIQGPPGSGKTYTGARMVCELIKRGLKVGVTALSHKVIRKLLDDVVEAAHELDLEGLLCTQVDKNGESVGGVRVVKETKEGWATLQSRTTNVLGGTSWVWSPEKAFEMVDVLFIDEAGQMSLADVLAVSQAAKKLVLLGDPQQLERPTKGSHPEGAERSALEHLLNGRKTIAADMGFLLPESWRLHPKICSFTSTCFYDEKLSSHALARSRVIEGHEWIDGAGLWFVPAEHEGNRNSSAEEVGLVARIVEGLLRPGVNYFYSAGNKRALKSEEILIVAPYNAQVADLKTWLPGMRIGTVDKFQGQEAPVVIYSLTTSSPEEAPRGMEFLYSLNRLNVATSRAMTAVILVGSPRLFEPECRTPRQMQLANALCAYREMAFEVDPQTI